MKMTIRDRLRNFAGIAYWIFLAVAGTAAQRVRERRLRRCREKIERARTRAGGMQGDMGPILQTQADARIGRLEAARARYREAMQAQDAFLTEGSVSAEHSRLAIRTSGAPAELIDRLDRELLECAEAVLNRGAAPAEAAWPEVLRAECEARLRPTAWDIAEHAREREAIKEVARAAAVGIISEFAGVWTELRGRDDVIERIRVFRRNLQDTRGSDASDRYRKERGE